MTPRERNKAYKERMAQQKKKAAAELLKNLAVCIFSLVGIVLIVVGFYLMMEVSEFGGTLFTLAVCIVYLYLYYKVRHLG